MRAARARPHARTGLVAGVAADPEARCGGSHAGAMDVGGSPPDACSCISGPDRARFRERPVVLERELPGTESRVVPSALTSRRRSKPRHGYRTRNAFNRGARVG